MVRTVSGVNAQPVPGNLAFHGILEWTLEQRLTRVGENSACKLHAILQRKFPSARMGAVGNLACEGNL